MGTADLTASSKCHSEGTEHDAQRRSACKWPWSRCARLRKRPATSKNSERYEPCQLLTANLSRWQPPGSNRPTAHIQLQRLTAGSRQRTPRRQKRLSWQVKGNFRLMLNALDLKSKKKPAPSARQPRLPPLDPAPPGWQRGP